MAIKLTQQVAAAATAANTTKQKEMNTHHTNTYSHFDSLIRMLATFRLIHSLIR